MRLKNYFAVLILTIISFFSSCDNKKEKIEDNYKYISKEVYEPEDVDFYNFKHYLDSDYAFDIKITNIKVVEHKGAFEVQKEKFGIPEKINGNSIVIDFDITNPYSRDMRIPFPEYFQIASNDFDGLKGFGYSRRNDTYVDFAEIIENDKGILLNKLGEYLSTKLNIDFKPYETKSFVIKFTEPFPSTIKKVLFIGFNKEFKDLESGGFDLWEYGLLIDLKNKKIIDLISAH